MTQIDKHEQFMRLLVANQPKIYAAIRSLGLRQHDAEDVLFSLDAIRIQNRPDSATTTRD